MSILSKFVRALTFSLGAVVLLFSLDLLGVTIFPQKFYGIICFLVLITYLFLETIF